MVEISLQGIRIKVLYFMSQTLRRVIFGVLMELSRIFVKVEISVIKLDGKVLFFYFRLLTLFYRLIINYRSESKRLVSALDL